LHWLLHPPRVAIAGAANVGKSTLANQLFGQERSITADVPGTTRDWIGETANLDGLAITLLDTPGIRDQPDSVETAALERAVREMDRADLIVLVLDATRAVEPEQSRLLQRFPQALCVMNKVDGEVRWDRLSCAAIQTIATAGKGIDDLRRAIRHRFQCDPLDPAAARCWTERQRQVVRQSLHNPATLASL
jgi:tRNA modification GTPase